MCIILLVFTEQDVGIEPLLLIGGQVLQPIKLHLANIIERAMGFEPTMRFRLPDWKLRPLDQHSQIVFFFISTWIKTNHVNQRLMFVQVEVIETSSSDWKSDALAIVLYLHKWSISGTIRCLKNANLRF